MWEYEEVSSTMGKDLATKYGLSFNQTSAMSATGIDVYYNKLGNVLQYRIEDDRP